MVIDGLYIATVKDIADPVESAAKLVPEVAAVTLNLPSVLRPCATLVYEANYPSKSINWK